LEEEEGRDSNYWRRGEGSEGQLSPYPPPRIPL